MITIILAALAVVDLCLLYYIIKSQPLTDKQIQRRKYTLAQLNIIKGE